MNNNSFLMQNQSSMTYQNQTPLQAQLLYPYSQSKFRKPQINNKKKDFFPQRPPTAEQEFKKLVSEIKMQKETEKQGHEADGQIKIPKCELHPQKPSNNCRNCKKNKALMDEIKKNTEEQPEVQPIEQYQNLQQSYNKVDKNLKIFPIWGDSSTYNINPLLRNNILSSQYFKDLYLLKTYHEVIDEICKKSTHVEPWAPGSNGVPSTLFCCLYKFMLMKLTIKQVKGLLEYKGNTYVRCVGFLYVRFCCDPEYLWEWLSKYLLDDEELHPSADPKVVTTVGDYVESLITEMTYYQTRFPRIPVMIDRNLRAKVLLMREKRERKRINIENIHLFQKGVKVKALSSQDGEWHFGVVERVEGKNVRVKFILEDQGGFSFKSNTVFYSGEEYVNFADIYILSEEEEEEERMRNTNSLDDKQTDKNDQKNKDSHEKTKRNRDSSRDSSHSSSKSRRHKKSKHKHHKHHRHHKKHHHKNQRRSISSSNSKSRSRSRSKSHNRSPSKKSKQQKAEKATKIMTEEEKYLEEVLRREKNGALANCKADYSKRPTSYKTSLSNPLPSGSTRTRSRSPSPIKKKEMFVETSAPKYEENKETIVKKITLSQEYIMRMKKLKETYGDASANASLLKNLTQKKSIAHQYKPTNESENSMGLEDVLKLGN